MLRCVGSSRVGELVDLGGYRGVLRVVLLGTRGFSWGVVPPAGPGGAWCLGWYVGVLLVPGEELLPGPRCLAPGWYVPGGFPRGAGGLGFLEAGRGGLQVPVVLAVVSACLAGRVGPSHGAVAGVSCRRVWSWIRGSVDPWVLREGCAVPAARGGPVGRWRVSALRAGVAAARARGGSLSGWGSPAHWPGPRSGLGPCLRPVVDPAPYRGHTAR